MKPVLARWSRRLLVFVALVAAGCSGGETPHPAPGAGSTVRWQGGDWYLHGVNMPWYNWACDFGCGADGGVSATHAELAPRFAQLDAANLRNVRWWMFEGEDPWQIGMSRTGRPTQLEAAVYADIDAALELARRYDLYYTFVLFAAPGDLPRDWLTDPAQRRDLVSALAPLFERYGREPHILAWEVFNEPEWEIWGGEVEAKDVRALVEEVTVAVHRSGETLVTVGSAALDGLPLWKGTGLDFYQAHWYDDMGDGERCALCTTYGELRERYRLDAPLVVGEFYAGPGAAGRFAALRDRGYAGAWAWSLWPGRTDDRLEVDMAEAASLERGGGAAIGPRRGSR